MSDQIEWSPLSIWSIGVAIQAYSAIRAWWKKERGNEISDDEQRRIIADRERRRWSLDRLRNGKKVDGWKLLNGLDDESLEQDCLLTRYRVLLPPWPKNGNAAPIDKSVLMFIEQDGDSNKMGRYIHRIIIRRYSLIASGVYDDIVLIYFDDGYFSDGWELSTNRDAQHISENILAIGWKQVGSGEIRIRLMLIDVRSKSYQIVETTGPQRITYIRSFIKGPSHDRLSVLFQVDDDDHNSFFLSDYSITPSEVFQSPIIRQVASRRLDWTREMWHFDLTFRQKFCFPGVYCGMYRYDPGAHLLDSRVISFDHNGIHDFGHVDDWIRNFMPTALGSRMVKAEKSLENLMPTDFSPDSPEFLLHRSHLFEVNDGGDFRIDILHRPLSPPSLLYFAAEAFCLANPDFDFARLKNMIRIDIFDGIYDGMPPNEYRI